MRKVALFLCFFLFLPCVYSSSLMAWPWGDKVLVSINGKNYTVEDFKHWWENYKDKDSPFPKTPDPFINWQLLVNEAERMELYKDPTYREKVSTFLKVRTLMILKNEEVDYKTDVSDKTLKKIYRKDYCPRWLMQIFYFRKKEDAQKAVQDLAKGKITFDGLIKRSQADKAARSRFFYQQRWVRPIWMPKAWKHTVYAMVPGQTSDVIAWHGFYVMFHIKDKKGPDDKDFKKVKIAIKRKRWDEEQARLTADLVRRLKAKYHVKVDRDLYKKLSLNNTPKELLDKVLISTNRGNITAGVFLNQVKKELRFRRKFHFKKQDINIVKNRVLQTIISQTLVSIEALERHYEQKPPFKWVYRFYCGHRLIKELEKRLFEPKATVSDEEIRAYYKKHINEFTRPETVSFALIEDDQKLLEKIWADISRGEDFFATAKKYYSRDIPVKRVPFNHLDKKIKAIIQKLSRGEVSPPTEINGRAVIIKLMDRTPALPIPLQQIRQRIAKKLEEQKFQELKANYEKKLRDMSEIRVNKAAWNELEREMGDGNEK